RSLLTLTRIVVQGLRPHSVKQEIATLERFLVHRLRKVCLCPVWTQPQRSQTSMLPQEPSSVTNQ
ncbi:hypothetical protein HPB47_026144, partial [Ixodes persulcatus]